METRQLGRTGHMSTVAILGGLVFAHTDQTETDALMEGVIAAGVNHIDVAPAYGEAELRLGPWLARERGRFFLGCKTEQCTQAGAAAADGDVRLVPTARGDEPGQVGRRHADGRGAGGDCRRAPRG